MEKQPDRVRKGSLDPRAFADVPPPPVQIVRRGWFRDTVTERQASELIEEARQRREKERRRSIQGA